MLINYIYYLSIFALITSCDSTEERKSTEQQNLSTMAKDTNARTNFLSGIFSDVSLAISADKTISGVYEYYDNWSETHKEFLDINVFYFSGSAIHDSTALIFTGWPDSKQKLVGQIVPINSNGKNAIKITLNGQPLGYNDVNFTSSEGVTMDLTKKTNWLQIRIIKSPKTKLYSASDSSSRKSGYLIQKDIVKVLDIKGNSWYQVEYSNVKNRSKSMIVWIRQEDLYDIDPKKW